MIKKIAVILINWKGVKDTLESLESILSQNRIDAFRVVIVDNNSGDGSVQRISSYMETKECGYEVLTYSQESDEPQIKLEGSRDKVVTLISASSNLGFCNGNNLGAKFAFSIGAEAALILNNDTVVYPDLIEKLSVAASELGPDVLISPQILYASKPETIWWCGGAFSKNLSPSYLNQGESKLKDGLVYPQTEWVSGCATLISYEIYEKIGLYDPIFFIWCEEWDLSLRAQRNNIPMHVAKNAIIEHKVGNSLGITSPLTFFYGMRNMIILRARYLSDKRNLLFSIIYFPIKLIQSISLSLKFSDFRFILAFLDASKDRKGGIWNRQG